jgi:CubicO group peptidase (beta-lactamase class C family)
MSKNNIGNLRVSMLKTQSPVLSRDAEFFIGAAKTWDLTFMINEEQAPTGRSAGSLAWAGLANTYMWIDPQRGVPGVYLTQILPFVDEKSFSLYLTFEKAVYQSLG